MAITEDQKKVIESTGHYVIEFKLWFRKKCQKIIDTMKAIVEWIVEIMTVHGIPAIRTAMESIKNTYTLFQKSEPNEMPKVCFPHIARRIQIYRFNAARSFKTIYHCRNNC
jgi:hypothetical protein